MVSFTPVFLVLKYSGLANRSVLNVSTKKTGVKETIVMTTSNKKVGKLLRPSRRLIETGLKKSAAKGKAKIDKMLLGGFYRRDMAELAKAKYDKLKASMRTKKFTVKSRRAPK